MANGFKSNTANIKFTNGSRDDIGNTNYHIFVLRET